MLGSQARDYLALTKPGITRHVMICAATGYVLAAPHPFGWPRLAWLVLGTALVSGGTNALNQWWERDVDARMPRTRRRPLAEGRVRAGGALGFALAIGGLGVATLAWTTNALTALLAAVTLLSYVLVYTPLKKRTSWNTIVGCIPGALPILGGWTAATGHTSAGGWGLFAVLFLWQLPHTLALTWMYRRDYRAGGLVMPGGDDERGRLTAAKAMGYCLLLAGASVALTPLGVTGSGYAVLAALLGATLLALTATWTRAPTRARARRVFLATLVYLPALMAGMVLGRS
jgi:protoheme IX farnesyltransferase